MLARARVGAQDGRGVGVAGVALRGLGALCVPAVGAFAAGRLHLVCGARLYLGSRAPAGVRMLRTIGVFRNIWRDLIMIGGIEFYTACCSAVYCNNCRCVRGISPVSWGIGDKTGICVGVCCGYGHIFATYSPLGCVFGQFGGVLGGTPSRVQLGSRFRGGAAGARSSPCFPREARICGVNAVCGGRALYWFAGGVGLAEGRFWLGCASAGRRETAVGWGFRRQWRTGLAARQPKEDVLFLHRYRGEGRRLPRGLRA